MIPRRRRRVYEIVGLARPDDRAGRASDQFIITQIRGSIVTTMGDSVLELVGRRAGPPDAKQTLPPRAARAGAVFFGMLVPFGLLPRYGLAAR